MLQEIVKQIDTRAILNMIFTSPKSFKCILIWTIF